MEFRKFEIEGLLEIHPRIFKDKRGYFFESYNKSKFDELVASKIEFIQDNESFSKYGTLRGFHFQTPPFDQSKLVRVIHGKVLDIAIDLRSGSTTYGKYQSVILTAEQKNQFFIPRGFAHAFLVLSESAIFSYKVDNIYAPQNDSGIFWNDLTLNINWPIPESDIIVSEKDKNLQSLTKYKLNPNFQ